MKLMQVFDADGKPNWLAALTDGDRRRLLVYLPNTGKWHRNKSLEYDYRIDREMTYESIEPAEALKLIKAGKVGRLDGRVYRDVLARYKADPDAKETAAVIPSLADAVESRKHRAERQAKRLRKIKVETWMPWNTYSKDKRQAAHVNASDLRSGRVAAVAGIPIAARVSEGEDGFRVEVMRKKAV